MKKIAFVAAFCLFIVILTSCNQTTPAPQPPATKTTVYLIKSGGGNDTTTTVSRSYEKTTMDSAGNIRTSGRTTGTSITKKTPTEFKLVVTDTIQPQSQQTQQPVTTTTTNNDLWWQILLVLLGIGIIVLLIWLLIRAGNHSSATAHATINPGCDINTATRTAMIQYEQNFRDRTMGIIDRAAGNGNLREFSVVEDEFSFAASGSFFKPRKTPSATVPATDKPADQKS